MGVEDNRHGNVGISFGIYETSYSAFYSMSACDKRNTTVNMSTITLCRCVFKVDIRHANI